MGVTRQMANEIRANIDVRGEQVAAAKLKKVGDAAEKAGDSLEELGGQAVGAGKATGKAGEDLKDAGGDADFLNRRVIELTSSYKGLVQQLNQTGDTSLLKDIGKERRQLRKFENLAKELVPDPGDAVKAGKSLGSEIMEGVGAAVDAGGPYVKGALIGVAALAAPGIATVIASAVLAGVGSGGIAAGVALAAQDPRVQAAGTALGEQLTHEFQDATRGFVDPVLRSLDKVANAGWADKLAPAFDTLAAKVDPLTDGLLGLVDEAVPGLTAAFNAAGPVLDALADGLPEIGDALGDFFMKIASNPEAAANAMELLINTITGTIDAAGDFIATMMVVYQGAYDVADAIGLIEEETVKLGKKIGPQGAAGDVEDFATATETAEKKLTDFDTAIQAVFGRTMGVREATINYEQAVDDLAEELTNGKRTLDEHTQAGRDNWNSINNVAEAIEEQRQARVRQGMGIDESNAKYDQELEALRKQLLSLNYNKEAVNKYIAELKKVPQQAITEVHLKGIQAALANIRSLGQAINAVVGYAAISVAAGFDKRASGGPVTAGRPYLVGERGPELVTFGANGMVHNATQTAAMMSGASGGAVAQTVNLQVTLMDPITGAVTRRALINDALARGVPESTVRSAYP